MNSLVFYILPGSSRFEDKIFHENVLNIEMYSPSNDKSLTEEDRRYRPNCVKVTIQGGDEKILPFVLPCYFDSAWLTLEVACEEMGVRLFRIHDVSDEDSIDRAMKRIWFATADGGVYTGYTFGGGESMLVSKWPINFDCKLLTDNLTEVV